VAIAETAGEGQIGIRRLAAVLSRDDVVDVKRHLRELFRKVNILAPELRARANRLGGTVTGSARSTVYDNQVRNARRLPRVFRIVAAFRRASHPALLPMPRSFLLCSWGRRLATFVLALGALLQPLAAASAGVPASPRTLHVLFLGNSFTNRHTLARIIKDMAEAGNPNLKFEYVSVIYAGKTLADHWKFASQNYVQIATLTAEEQARTIASLTAFAVQEPQNGALKSALTRHTTLAKNLEGQRQRWDVVVLQSYKDDGDGDQSSYCQYAPKFAALAKAAGARVVLYETTPNTQNERPLTSPPDPAPVVAKARVLAGLARRIGATVVPMSSVALRCQATQPQFTLRYLNDAHPNQTMAYLTACTFYGVLFDRSPAGQTVDTVTETRSGNKPDQDPDGNPLTRKFSAQERAQLQQAAWDGLQWFRETTEDKLPRVAQTFELQGHKAFIYASPAPAKGMPWLWYAPTLKGISLVGRKVYFETLMRAGIGLAGIDLGEVRGAPGSTAKFTLFYDEMVRRGWSPKPILLGQSRGGLTMLAWAVRNPEKVRAFVGIYPVCNLATWGMKGKAVTLADFGLSEAELVARMSEFNPLDNLQGLLARKVPMFVVQGDSDRAVPYEENTRLLKERYEAGGGQITVKLIPGEGHMATPSFFECRELMDFVIAHGPR
jgi:hypothetical protein